MSSHTLATKLARVKPGTLFVGMDLGLDRNVAVILTERAKPLARFGFSNDRDGYDYFYRRLEALQERQQAPAVGWYGADQPLLEVAGGRYGAATARVPVSPGEPIHGEEEP